MSIKYHLNFDGSIGDFIKQHRKAKKINSVDLSKKLGKSGAYISQIENGHNKKPDYDMLHEIFKQVGIEEVKIEDYLEHFDFLSLERAEQRNKKSLKSQEITEEEFIQLQQLQQKQEENDYLNEIINNDLKKIVSILTNVASDQPSEGYGLIRGLGSNMENMERNQLLYKFMIRFFDKDLSLLDEDGMIKAINTLYEEMNRRRKETTAFGEPRLINEINKL